MGIIITELLLKWYVLHMCSHSSHVTFCRQIFSYLTFRMSEIKLSMGGNASNTDKMKYRRENTQTPTVSECYSNAEHAKIVL